MNISMEIKKAEAIKRMKALDIYEETIRQFKEGLVSCSEPPYGANFWLDDDQEKFVKEFEAEYNAIVYFIIRSYTNFGQLDSILYVSDHKEEWEMDDEDIKDGYAVAYVRNYDVPEYSEFGTIAVENRFGGLVRVG